MHESKMDEKYKNFFSQSLEMLCIADKDGKFVELNPRWIEVLG
ncbi:MAG: PAS domain S-box protein [Oligoflexales bacterium]|nr:PAS domain S-box protein [Oligoflexales bacterium]